METDDTQGRRERHVRPAHARAKTRPSPGWPPASSGSSCPTSSTTSRSIQQIAAEAASAATPIEALEQLAADLREPPAVSQGGRVLAAAVEGISQRESTTSQELAAAARPDRRQLGPLRAGPDPAGRPRRHGRVPLPQRQAGRLHGPRNQGRQAAGRREGLSQVESRATSTGRRSTSATSAIGWSSKNQKQYLGEQVAQWRHGPRSRARTISTSASPSPRRCRSRARIWSTAKMAGGNTSRIVVWVDDTAIVKKPLDGKTYYYVADAVTGKPIAKANVEFFGWQQTLPRQAAAARSRHQAVRRVHRRRRPGRSPIRSSQPHDYPVADHRPDAAKAASPISASPASGTANWYDAEYNADEGLHHHRPAGLSARAEGEVQVLGPPRQVRHGRHVRLRQPDVHGRDPQSQGREDRSRRR